MPELARFNMELETVGFHPAEVDKYIKNTVARRSYKSNGDMVKKIQDMQNFIKEHWLIQSLVRISIQLDAICFTWEDSTFSKSAPQNISGLCAAIELKLCNKDILHLKEGREAGAPNLRTRTKVVQHFGDVLACLEALAFVGLYNNIIEFNQHHRDVIDVIDTHILPSSKVTEDQLEKLSFLRAVDSSLDPKSGEYYFIHLTFQEYFTARYFVRHWKEKEPLVSVIFGTQHPVQVSPDQFVECEKYNRHYHVMWRFVTGLLQTECESALYPFLQKLQAEPRDLLGPTHLRLLMHCFSELSVIPDHTGLARLKAWLDRQLAQYLLFEGQIGRRRYDLALKNVGKWGSSLGYELEYSEVLLGKILKRGIYLNKQIALETISGRPQIS